LGRIISWILGFGADPPGFQLVVAFGPEFNIVMGLEPLYPRTTKFIIGWA